MAVSFFIFWRKMTIDAFPDLPEEPTWATESRGDATVYTRCAIECLQFVGPLLSPGAGPCWDPSSLFSSCPTWKMGQLCEAFSLPLTDIMNHSVAMEILALA